MLKQPNRLEVPSLRRRGIYHYLAENQPCPGGGKDKRADSRLEGPAGHTEGIVVNERGRKVECRVGRLVDVAHHAVQGRGRVEFLADSAGNC